MGLCCGSCCGADDSNGWCGRRRRNLEYSGAAVLASATAPAMDDGSGQRTLALPLHQCLPWKLSDKKCITIRGRVPKNAYRWAVNLMNGGMDDDIALHINPRHDLGYVVRNSRENGSWGTEEICAETPMPFLPGEDFELAIFCTERSYLIAVNGRHLATFAARIPPSTVKTLHVTAGVELHGVEYTENVAQYPPRPAPALVLADRPGAGYRADRPVFPCRLPETIQDGGEIRLAGRVKLLPFSFHVRVLTSSCRYPEPSIVLYINPRFQVRQCFDVVVINSWAEGWGKEVEVRDFPFRAGRHFVLKMACRSAGWDVSVDGRRLVQFPHRLPAGRVGALDVSGDVVVETVYFDPNSKDLIQL